MPSVLIVATGVDGIVGEQDFQGDDPFPDQGQVPFGVSAERGEFAGGGEVVSTEASGGTFGGVGWEAKDAQGLGTGIEGAAGQFMENMFDPGIEEAQAMIHALGSDEEGEFGELLLTGGDQVIDGGFVIDGDDEELGFSRAGGVEDFGSGGVAIVNFEAEAAGEFDMLGVGFEDHGAEALGAEEATDVISEPSESGEDDGGMVFDWVVGALGGLGGQGDLGEVLLMEKQGKRGEGHGQGDDRVDFSGNGFGQDAHGEGLADEDKGEFSALEHGEGVEGDLTGAEAEDGADAGQDQTLDEDEADEEEDDANGFAGDEGEVHGGADADEEQSEEQTLEGFEVAFEFVAVGTGGQHHPADEGSEGG